MCTFCIYIESVCNNIKQTINSIKVAHIAYSITPQISLFALRCRTEPEYRKILYISANNNHNNGL